MNSIILGFSVVFPLLAFMVLGYLVKKLNWLSDKTIDEMNSLVFKVFMSSLIFLNTYAVDPDLVFKKENIQLIVLSLSIVMLTIIFLEFSCRKLKVEADRKAVLVQSGFRSNLALFGLAVNIAIYGEGNQGIVAILMAVLIPVFNVAAVIILANANKNQEKIKIRDILISIAKNPLVIASVSGVVFSFMNIKFPETILGILNSLAKVSTPLAFILLGAGLNFKNMTANIKPIICITIMKLVIVPVIILGIAIYIGIRNEELVALLGCFASPVAVVTYTMSKNKGIAPELAGEIIAATTITSIFTIFVFISTLSYLSLI